MLRFFSEVRRTRDLVFVDQHGTGGNRIKTPSPDHSQITLVESEQPRKH